jgi:hypothetical protein
MVNDDFFNSFEDLVIAHKLRLIIDKKVGKSLEMKALLAPSSGAAT